MDRTLRRRAWSWSGLPPAARAGLACVVVLGVVLLAIKFIAGSAERVFRLPLDQATLASVEQGIFRDLIPLRVSVVPRTTVYVDAIDGGRVDRVLVEAGDVVQEGQPLLELSNTNLVLQVIQQESQLNQAISQLQQNEIALEQNKLSNERAVAEIDYQLVRLQRSAARRQGLAAQNVIPVEQRDLIADELAYYRRLKPIQAESTQRQANLHDRLLPDIHEQLKNLRGNLAVVRSKLDGLVIRAPATGRVAALDLKVGETPAAGQRLAEIIPDTGMKLSANIDEFYLSRVRVGLLANIELAGKSTLVRVRRVAPQVKDGNFTIDLDFEEAAPPSLVAGEAAQGHLLLGDDTPAHVLRVGPFLAQTGGDWAFVVTKDGKFAERRKLKVGRRTAEQLEILGGVAVGEQVLISDYTGFSKVDRVALVR